MSLFSMSLFGICIRITHDMMEEKRLVEILPQKYFTLLFSYVPLIKKPVLATSLIHRIS